MAACEKLLLDADLCNNSTKLVICFFFITHLVLPDHTFASTHTSIRTYGYIVHTPSNRMWRHRRQNAKVKFFSLAATVSRCHNRSQGPTLDILYLKRCKEKPKLKRKIRYRERNDRKEPAFRCSRALFLLLSAATVRAWSPTNTLAHAHIRPGKFCGAAEAHTCLTTFANSLVHMHVYALTPTR